MEKNPTPNDYPLNPIKKQKVYGGKMIEWDGNMPIAVHAPIIITTHGLKELAITALNLPYEGDIDEETHETIIEQRFIGLSNAEVAFIRQAERAARGDEHALNLLLDRAIGKPKQSMESLNVTVSFQDYLDQLSQHPDFSDPNHPTPQTTNTNNNDQSQVTLTITPQNNQPSTSNPKTNSHILNNRREDDLDDL